MALIPGVNLGGLGFNSIFSGLLNVVKYILLITIPIGVAFLFYKWKAGSKKYTYKVHWWGIDGITGGFDEGGVFVDGVTKAKRFYLRRAKTSLDADKLVWRLLSGRGETRMVYLQRVSTKDFRYVDTAPLSQGLSSTVGEEDVNWAIHDYEKQKKAFGSNTLTQLLVWGGIVACGIIILLMIIFVLQKLPDLKETWGIALKTAQVLAQVKTGTTVVN